MSGWRKLASGAKREGRSQKDKQVISRALCQEYLKMLRKLRQENGDLHLGRIFKLQKSLMKCWGGHGVLQVHIIVSWSDKFPTNVEECGTHELTLSLIVCVKKKKSRCSSLGDSVSLSIRQVLIISAALIKYFEIYEQRSLSKS